VLSLRGRSGVTGRPVRLQVDAGHITALDEVDDGPPLWLLPGLVDIQVNGYAGADVNGADVQASTIVSMVEALWARGTTTVFPTVVTGSQQAMQRSLRAVARARAVSPLVAHSIPRVHVEGPCISAEDGPRGAHAPEHIRPPSPEEFGDWQEACEHIVGVVTLAPELRGALSYIGQLARLGVVVAIGHTAARPDEIRAAVEAGATLSTHLGNGSHAMLARLDNYVWEQLGEDRLWASFIFDGHHLPPPVMRSMVRAKGVERSVLVSDAVSLAGAAPGTYSSAVGGTVQLHRDGRLEVLGTGYLAGSTSDLLAGVGNAVRMAGLDLATALRLATANPARLTGLDGHGARGFLEPGASADVAVVSWPSEGAAPVVVATLVAGRVVYRDETAADLAACLG
jgi:N-acetylglucosamine-6-phosphate deacetylase